MTLHGETLPADIPSRAAQPRIGLNILFGVPDDGKDAVRVSPDGRKLIAAANGVGKFTLRGSANIAPYLSERFALNRYYLQDDAAVLAQIAPGPILNHIADQDICSRALALVEHLADRERRPCFNHPRAVARTTRDGVALSLSGIPGLTVPKTIRVDRTSPASVREATKNAGLTYPILVRVVGSHGGEDRLRIDRPEAMDEIAQLPYPDRPVYLTEFYDFVSPDGFYRKYRVVVVGDDIFLRQCVVGTDWSLHGRHRVEGADREEADLFQSFQTGWVPTLKPVFDEITRRLGLDYFGVDCHIDTSLNVLLFEANACMKILKNYRALPNRFEAPIALIKTALENRLASPETWLYAPAGG
jgi:glutathione synthase/RimK-type ligase-like ATP-grasp enzyme